MQVRLAAPIDLPAICRLEAASSVQPLAGDGPAELARQWRNFPSGALVAVADGTVIGAILSVRMADAKLHFVRSELSAPHVATGPVWVILSVLQKRGADERVGEQLLVSTLQLAATACGVQLVMVALPCSPLADAPPLLPPAASLVQLVQCALDGSVPALGMHLARGARLLQRQQIDGRTRGERALAAGIQSRQSTRSRYTSPAHTHAHAPALASDSHLWCTVAGRSAVLVCYDLADAAATAPAAPAKTVALIASAAPTTPAAFDAPDAAFAVDETPSLRACALANAPTVSASASSDSWRGASASSMIASSRRSTVSRSAPEMLESVLALVRDSTRVHDDGQLADVPLMEAGVDSYMVAGLISSLRCMLSKPVEPIVYPLHGMHAYIHIRSLRALRSLRSLRPSNDHVRLELIRVATALTLLPVAETILFECGTPRRIAERLLPSVPAAKVLLPPVGSGLPAVAASSFLISSTCGRWPGGGRSGGASGSTAAGSIAGDQSGNGDAAPAGAVWHALWSASGDAIRPLPQSRWVIVDGLTEEQRAAHPIVGHLGCVLHAQRFDHGIFGIGAAEAHAIDPQQRLLLEHGYESLCGAGLHRRTLSESDTAVCVGLMSVDHAQLGGPLQLASVYAAISSAPSIAAGRLSFTLDVRGPCATVDTACSSALSALHFASHCLRSAESSVALVASVSLILTLLSTSERFARAGMLSADGRCKTLDACANGYVRSEGVNALVAQLEAGPMVEPQSTLLQRASQALSSRVMQDGRSASLTAPNGTMQTELVSAALQDVVRSSTWPVVIEAHGTGTALGDPTEVSSLIRATAATAASSTADADPQCRDARLVLTSGKASVGHSEPVAGAAGLERLLQALSMRTGGSIALLRTPSRICAPLLAGGTMAALTQPVQLDTQLMAPSATGGVSSFGYSGTIAHAAVRTPVPALNVPAIEQHGALGPLLPLRRRTFRWVEVVHPLLQRLITPEHELIAKHTAAAVYRTPIAGAFLALVGEHRLHGKVVCPAAAYLEMARAAGSSACRATCSAAGALEGASGAGTLVGMKSVVFLQPLFPASSDAEDGVVPASAVLHVSIGVSAGAAQLEVSSGTLMADALHSSLLHCAASLSDGTTELSQGTSHAPAASSASSAAAPSPPPPPPPPPPATAAATAASSAAAAASAPVSASASALAAAGASYPALSPLGTIRLAQSLYTELHSLGLEYGPSYRQLHSLATLPPASGGTCAFIATLRQCGRRARAWAHPARLDAVLQVCVLPHGGRAELRLPFSIAAAVLPRQCWPVQRAFLTMDAADQTVDVLLHDCSPRHGRSSVPISQLSTFRSRAPKLPSRTALDGVLYETCWLAADTAGGARSNGTATLSCGCWKDELANVLMVARDMQHDLMGGGVWGDRDRLMGPLKQFSEAVHAMGHGTLLFCAPAASVDEIRGLALGLDFLQGCEQWSEKRSLWLLTTATQAGSVVGRNCTHAGLWGLWRVARLELPAGLVRCIDTPTSNHAHGRDASEWPSCNGMPANLASLAALPDVENEACADERRSWRVPRLVSASATRHERFRLCVHARGSISSLYVEAMPPVAPDDEVCAVVTSPATVEILIRAAGLNFRDVLDVLGLYPQATPELCPGDDCAGVVQRHGDTSGRASDERVFGSPGFAPGLSCFASHAIVAAALIAPMPVPLSFEQACTLPTTFSTIITAFEVLRLRAAAGLLMHAAGGGVGLVGCETAVWMGARLLATVGKPGKHRTLRQDLGIQCTLSSREGGAFGRASSTMGGTRSHAALNSLSVDFIPVSVGLLTEGGNMLEIGKRSVWGGGRMTAAVGATRHLVALDIAALAPAQPQWYHRVLQLLTRRVEAGALNSLPLQSFELTRRVQQAYRLLQSGENIGKVVLRIVADEEPRSSVADGTMLVTGGLGGLGLRHAYCLAQQGARCILLCSRYGRVQAAEAAEYASLQALCAGLRVEACNVSCPRQVLALGQRLCGGLPPLHSIIHAAGALADALLPKQTHEHLRRVLGPKVVGGAHLHAALPNAASLRSFSMVSSIIGALGNVGQAPYAAANAWLDSFALCRCSLGLPAHATQWGYVAEVGMAARHQLADTAARLGFGLVSREMLTAALDVVLGVGSGSRRHLRRSDCCSPSVAVVPARWPAVAARYAHRPSQLLGLDQQSTTGSAATANGQGAVAATFVRGIGSTSPAGRAASWPVPDLAAILQLAQRVSGDVVDADMPLMEAGIDSLGAVELRNELQRALGDGGSSVPSTVVFDFSTARLIAEHIGAVSGSDVDARIPMHRRCDAMIPAVASDGTRGAQVTGMSSSLPGNSTKLGHAWMVQCCAHTAVRDVPTSRWDVQMLNLSSAGRYSASHGGFLHAAHLFDAPFFGISRAEAHATDPQHRLLLEHGYEAMHMADTIGESLAGSATGIFVAICHEDFRVLTQERDSVYASIGYAHSIASGRLSYVLGLHGPCVSVDTACSSALVAAYSAELSLHTDVVPMSLAAGINIMLIPEVALRFAKASMLSQLGGCHTFDRRADGFARAEGCCAVTLQPPSPPCTTNIEVVAVQQDGRSASLTAPNGLAQQQLLQTVHAASRFTIDTIETHGTGTALGDPIEVSGLSSGLHPRNAEQRLQLSGVKGNLGHTESTAGLTGLHALLVALRKGSLMPNAQLRELNPHLVRAVAGSSMMLPVQLAATLTARERGGVSSFGYSGTIAHAVLRTTAVGVPLALAAFMRFRRCTFDWSSRLDADLVAETRPSDPIIRPEIVRYSGTVDPWAVVRLIRSQESHRVAVFHISSLAMEDNPQLHDAYHALLQCAMPIIVVCKGQTRDGGMLFPSLATITLAYEGAQFHYAEHVSPVLADVIRRRVRRSTYLPGQARSPVTISAQEAFRCGLVDFVGSVEATDRELHRLWMVLEQIPQKLMRLSQAELPAVSEAGAMVTMGALDKRGRERHNDEGTFVRLHVDDNSSIATLELYDPHHFNSFSYALGDDFASAVACLAGLQSIRGAVLQGAGQHFSVGGNPYRSSEFASVPLPTLSRTVRELYVGFLRLRGLRAAVACAVHGTVVGGGLAACLNCDYTIAAATTSFQHGNLSRGVCPLGLLSQTFVQTVGRGRALEIYLQDAKLTCETAVEIGLVDEMRDDFDGTQARARDIASLAADHEAVSLALRSTRAQVDPQIQALEALGHAACQKANSGLLTQSPVRDHHSATVPLLVGMGELRFEPLLEQMSLGRVGVAHIWLGEVIQGEEAPTNSRAICVYRGRGENFCLGGDASARKVRDGSFLNRLADFCRLAQRIDAHKLPILTLCHGATRGGGMLFASVASALLAHTDATFGFPEIHRGVLPGVVSVAAQRRLNRATCERLMCMRDAIGAAEALRLGFVDFVGVAEELEGEAARLTSRMCHFGAPLLRRYGFSFRRGFDAVENAAETQAAEVGEAHHPHAFPFGIDRESGIAVVDLGPDAAASLAHFCMVASAGPLRATLRVVALNVGLEPQPLQTLLVSTRSQSRLQTAMRQLYDLQVPIVCVASGLTAGLGLSTFLCADYRIAEEGTTLCFDLSNRWQLHLLMRPADRRALQAERGLVPAKAARQLGLLSELCPQAGPWPKRASQRATAFASWLSNHSALSMEHVLKLSRARLGCPPRNASVSITAGASSTALEDLPGEAKFLVLQGHASKCEAVVGLQKLLSVASAHGQEVLPSPHTQPPSGRLDAIKTQRIAPFRQLRRRALDAPRSRAGAAGTGGALSPSVGIHRLEVYLSRHCASAEMIGGMSGAPDLYTRGLMMEQYAACGEDEDASSMVLTAVTRLLHAHNAVKEHVGFIHVGGALSLDRSKSIKSDIMRRFEVADVYDVEGLDAISATHGGAAALHASLAWASSAAWDGRWAIMAAVESSSVPSEGGQPALSNIGAISMLIGAGAPIVLSPARNHVEMHQWNLLSPVGGRDTMDCIGAAETGAACFAALYRAQFEQSSIGASGRVVFCSPGGPSMALALYRHICASRLGHSGGRGGGGANAHALHPMVLRGFEREVASTLRFSAAVGSLISSSLLPLAALLMGDARLPSGGEASLFTGGHGSSTASICRLTSDGSAVSSDTRLVAALLRRRQHTPDTLRIVAARREQSHGHAFGWSCHEELSRPGGTYYLKEVTAIGQREYESVGMTLLSYAQIVPSLSAMEREGSLTRHSAARSNDRSRSPVVPLDQESPSMRVRRASRERGDGLDFEATSDVMASIFDEAMGMRAQLSRRPSVTRSRRPSIGVGDLSLGVARAAKKVHAIARELLHGDFSADMPLMEAGLDSFGVMEFHSRLSHRLNAPSLPETLVFDYPTIRQLEAYVTSRAAESGMGIKPMAAARTQSPTDMLMQLVEGLSKSPSSPKGHCNAVRSSRQSKCTHDAVPALSAENVAASVTRTTQGLLGKAPPLDVPLLEAGLDSLAAIELRGQLAGQLNCSELPDTLVFDFPTLRLLQQHLVHRLARAEDQQSQHEQSSLYTDVLASTVHGQASTVRKAAVESADAQVAGVSMRLPAAIVCTITYWNAIGAAVQAVEDAPAARGWDLAALATAPSSVHHGALISEPAVFDNAYFGVSSSEASAMDPQQRLVLEHGYEALHDAGRTKATLHGSRIGVELGVYALDFKEMLVATPAGEGVYAATGATLSIASGRLSYVLGLHGQCVSIDTACSAALVATHYALCEIILKRANVDEAHSAHLAAGVNIMLVPSPSLIMAVAGMTSLLGCSHTFDRRADGFARAEGCCAVTLQPPSLPCTTNIEAVAVQQDGRSASLTAPNGLAQQQLLQTVHAASRFTIDTIETHGTGTALGDPIEVSGLSSGLHPRNAEQRLQLSGVKGNLGHTESTAGLTGLHALLVALRKGSLMPNAQLRELNPHLVRAVAGSSMMLPVQLAATLTARERGGVSSFGYGGTIAHAVLRAQSRAQPSAVSKRVHFRRCSFLWLPQCLLPLKVKGPAYLTARSEAAATAIDEMVGEARMPPSERDAVVVGGGLAGLVVSAALSNGRLSVVILEKTAMIGGVWRHHGNMLSRVNSSEPSYRLPVKRPCYNTNHSYHHEVLRDIHRLLDQRGLGEAVFTSTEVTNISPAGGGGYELRGLFVHAGSQPFALRAQLVAICTNRRLGEPRELRLPGEESWDGEIRRGLHSDVAAVRWRRQHAVVVGMGAFAVESMRSALEGSAKKVTFLCRRRGTICPQIIDWVYFVRPRQANGWAHAAAGDARVLAAWQQVYDVTRAARPECWAAGVLKPDGHTVSVSDIFFAAHHLQLVTTILGEAAQLECGGVRTATGDWLDAQILIKCVGFELNRGNSTLLNTQRMRGFGLVDTNLWVQVEPHLDAGQFASPFGSSYLGGVHFTAMLMLRYWHQPELASTIAHAIPPTAPIDSFTSSAAHEGLRQLIEQDSEIGHVLRDHVAQLASDFHETCTPTAYLLQNEQQWGSLHRRLRPLAYSTPAARLPPTPYPFYDMLRLLEEEAPWLVSPEEAAGATGAGAASTARDASTRADMETRADAPHSARHAMTLDVVMGHLSAVVGTDAADVALSADAPLMETGLESLGAVELHNQLQRAAGKVLPSTLVFDHPTARSVTAFITGLNAISGPSAVPPPHPASARPSRTQASSVHGLALRAPRAISSMRALSCVRNTSSDAITFVLPSRWQLEMDEPADSRVLHGGFVDGLAGFDARRFRVVPAEASAMDPQQRLLLEYGYESLYAALGTTALVGSMTGIFLGIQAVDYLHAALSTASTVYTASGGSHSIASGRLAYVLHLQGPCISADTACSATLVAGHAAHRAVQLHEAVASLAIGVNVMLVPSIHRLFAVAGMTSASGRCSTFDTSADGYARAEAIAAATLLPSPASQSGLGTLEATWWAGSAVRQDGARASLTAPSGRAQEALLRGSLSEGGLTADALSCNEAHGTGTSLGDPIEVHSLSAAILIERTLGGRAVAIASVKANAGHAEPAAGLVGLLSLPLAVASDMGAAPNARLRQLNPFIASTLQGAPTLHSVLPVGQCQLSSTEADATLQPSEEADGTAGGVSSFGYSGTIAHVALCRPFQILPPPSQAISRILYRRRHFAFSAVDGTLRSTPLSDGTIVLYGIAWRHRTTAAKLATATTAVVSCTVSLKSLLVLQAGAPPQPSEELRLRFAVPSAAWSPSSSCGDSSTVAERMAATVAVGGPCATLACLLAPSRGGIVTEGYHLALEATRHCLSLPSQPPTLWFLSVGAKHPLPLKEANGLLGGVNGSGGLWGLAGSLRLEHPAMPQIVTDIANEQPTIRMSELLAATRSISDASNSEPCGGSMAIAKSEPTAWATRTEHVARLVAASASRCTRLRHTADLAQRSGRCHGSAPASHLISGGLGGLGLLAAGHLGRYSSARLVLVSRRANVTAAATISALTALDARGARVRVLACDAAVTSDMMAAICVTVGAGARLGCVLHAAGVTDDRTIQHTESSQLTAVLAPKASCAWSLHGGTSSLPPSEGVLLLSSVTAAFGNFGQSNYAVANAYLDALAVCMRAQGRTASSLQSLPVAGIGLSNTKTVERLEADLGGAFHLDADAFVAWIALMLAQPSLPSAALPSAAPPPPSPPATASHLSRVSLVVQMAIPASAEPTLHIMPAHPLLLDLRAVDPTSKPATRLPTSSLFPPDGVKAPAVLSGAGLQAALLLEVGLLTAATDIVELDAPLAELGLDSISTMELRGRIEAIAGVRLRNNDMLASPSIRSLLQLIEQASHVDASLSAGLASRPWANSSIVCGYAPLPQAQLERPIVFLLSSPRAGSSLMQLCLNAHPRLYAGQELFLLPFATLGERHALLHGSGFEEGLLKAIMDLKGVDLVAASRFLDELGPDCPTWRVYAELQSCAAPRVLVDKTPPNAERLIFLRRAHELFANASYVHLVRHPYATIASGLELARNVLAASSSWAELEELWLETNVSVVDFFAQVRGSAPTLTLTYEQLVTDAPAATRAVCTLLGMPWEEAMAAPYETEATRSFEPASRVAATDPKLLRRRGLEPQLANKWREVLLPQPLGTASKALALSLGYQLLPELPAGLAWLSRRAGAAGGPPIVCIHDFTGALWAYTHLAPLLPAACLGLGCPLGAALAECADIDTLARRYLLALPASLWHVDPQCQATAQATAHGSCPDRKASAQLSPVHLVGYSLGCRIAHRMACQLEAVGRQVTLVLLDGPIGAHGGGQGSRLLQHTKVVLSRNGSTATGTNGTVGRNGGLGIEVEGLPGNGAAASSLARGLGALPEALERALVAAGDGAREVAAGLMQLPDPDPSGYGIGERSATAPTPTLYVAARASHNALSSTPQKALQYRPAAAIHTVDGTHFDFLSKSAAEVAALLQSFYADGGAGEGGEGAATAAGAATMDDAAIASRHDCAAS